MSFGQGGQGAIFDSEGDAALEVRVTYKGNVNGDTGTLNVDFMVTSRDQIYTYQGRLDLSQRSRVGQGWRYWFGGIFKFVAGPDGQPLPTSGVIRVALDFWPDGSIYRADLLLD